MSWRLRTQKEWQSFHILIYLLKRTLELLNITHSHILFTTVPYLMQICPVNNGKHAGTWHKCPRLKWPQIGFDFPWKILSWKVLRAFASLVEVMKELPYIYFYYALNQYKCGKKLNIRPHFSICGINWSWKIVFKSTLIEESWRKI